MAAMDITSDFKDLKSKRENLVFMARTAESAERYEDMCKVMKVGCRPFPRGSACAPASRFNTFEIALPFPQQLLVEWNEGKTPLDIEERNLLSVAYKNVIGTRRASHRCLSVEDFKNTPFIDDYKKIIEKELDDICQEVLALLTKTLVPGVRRALKEAEKGTDPDKTEISRLQEAFVFYLKMTGDYYRYLAEIIKDQDYVDSASQTYQQALDIAEKHLLPTHPIRLGLALNFSVCYYEIIKDQTKACDLAKKAFDMAIAKLDSIDEASYKDSTLIMQLLRDNLTLWTSPDNNMDDTGGDGGDKEDYD